MVYVLQVQPHKELNVCSGIKRHGITAYSPRRELVIHKNGLWTKVINTLFPGYVFMVGEYTPEIHHKVKSIDGVIRFLGSPSPLPKREADMILWLCNDGKVIEQSFALVNDNDIIIGFEGFLEGCEDNIAYLNRRQRKASVEVRFGGKIHRANLGIELKRADSTKSEENVQG